MNADFGQKMDRLDTHGITTTHAHKDNIFSLKNCVHYLGKNLLVKKVMCFFQ